MLNTMATAYLKASFAFLFILPAAVDLTSPHLERSLKSSQLQQNGPYCGGFRRMYFGESLPFYYYYTQGYPFYGIWCIWQVDSPPNTAIKMECEISVDCDNKDYFYFSQTGKPWDQNMVSYCGKKRLVKTTDSNNFYAGFFANPWYRYTQYTGVLCVLTVVEPQVTPPPVPTTKPKPVVTTTTDSSASGKCSCGLKGGKRVVGGQEASVNAWPWQVALRYKGSGRNVVFCGATVICQHWILTAAHCADPFQARDVSAHIGEHDQNDQATGEEEIPIAEIIIHEQYNANTVDNDIALMRLSRPISSDLFSPVCLPFGYVGHHFGGATGTVTGWGATSFQGDTSNVLLEADIPILTTSECREYSTVSASLTDNMLCTYKEGLDACQGDSGGPLVWEKEGLYYQIGIVSWGEGCAAPDSPGVYAKMTKYLQWIEDKTKNCKLCRP